ncbi:hypothetical protein PR048_018203 [Dryococelus australis]|uniref:Uncharacterized protein n=1 Tax=Dryococelus australis TaxID=614101 RepID=A0ABQ9HBM3_9NEOP|nr:hypothetical protein PR048_018203 [Dryococelus australis]
MGRFVCITNVRLLVLQIQGARVNIFGPSSRIRRKIASVHDFRACSDFRLSSDRINRVLRLGESDEENMSQSDFEENHISLSVKNVTNKKFNSDQHGQLMVDFEGAYYTIMKARAKISQERPSGQIGIINVI